LKSNVSAPSPPFPTLSGQNPSTKTPLNGSWKMARTVATTTGRCVYYLPHRRCKNPSMRNLSLLCEILARRENRCRKNKRFLFPETDTESSKSARTEHLRAKENRPQNKRL
jgi:hypothetical protein